MGGRAWRWLADRAVPSAALTLVRSGYALVAGRPLRMPTRPNPSMDAVSGRGH